ncbi:MAG: signal recognition particle-docking protein FtsY, partial [Methanotrichaceae archaeon]
MFNKFKETLAGFKESLASKIQEKAKKEQTDAVEAAKAEVPAQAEPSVKPVEHVEKQAAVQAPKGSGAPKEPAKPNKGFSLFEKAKS